MAATTPDNPPPPDNLAAAQEVCLDLLHERHWTWAMVESSQALNLHVVKARRRQEDKAVCVVPVSPNFAWSPQWVRRVMDQAAANGTDCVQDSFLLAVVDHDSTKCYYRLSASDSV